MESTAQTTPTAAIPSEPQKTEAPKDTVLAPAETKQEVKTEASAPTEVKPVVPEKYDLKLPEGTHLDKSVVDRIATEAREQGLSNEQAQKLLEREHGAIASYISQAKSQWEQRQSAWVQEVEKDTEVGGDHFKESVAISNTLINKFGSDALKNELRVSGYGNHPELVRFCTRIAKEMGIQGDSFVSGNAQGTKQKSLEEVFYGAKQE